MATPQAERARLGAITRWSPHDQPAQRNARRDLAAAKIEQYIRRVVDDSPPLTTEQRDRLAVLLRGGGANDAA